MGGTGDGGGLKKSLAILRPPLSSFTDERLVSAPCGRGMEG